MKSKSDLRIVYMGTPEFAVQGLKLLLENNYNIVGVITSPDKPAGRGKKIRYSAVKEFALENNLNILQPEKLKNPEFLKELEALKADLQIVVAFRMLPELVWDMPSMGTFNLHASLLPQYRGAAPINHSIINGETKTGVTTFFLDKEIDTGKIIMQKEVDIKADDDAGSLHDKLMLVGGEVILKTVEKILKGEFVSTDQETLINDKELKHAPKIFKEDCKINWDESSLNVHNKIRGLSPYPAAFTILLNDTNKTEISLKIYQTKISDKTNGELPGSVKVEQRNLKIATRDAWLEITELQMAGKKRMKTSDFLLGTNLESGFIAVF